MRILFCQNKPLSLFLILTGIFVLDFSAFGQALHLDVEGNALIRGLVEITHPDDHSSIYVGTNSGENVNPGLLFSTTYGVRTGLNLQSGQYNSIFGFEAGFSQTIGTGNSYFGAYAGFGDTGSNNSYFGYFSATNGLVATSGNSFFGAFSGQENEGFNNSFYGSHSGFLNESGSNNAFYGYYSGYSNTDGANNAFYGDRSGLSNTSGEQNSFFGSESGWANTTGSQNTYQGYRAGTSNTTGDKNSFYGALAGEETTTGHSNSFFGYGAGTANQTGIQNAFYGGRSGSENTSGSNNSFFGYGSGNSNTEGSMNSFFGDESGIDNTTGESNSIFGSFAGQRNESGSSNSFFGARAGLFNNGDDNTFVGYSAGYFNVGGTKNTFIGSEASRVFTDLHRSIAIGYNALVDCDNCAVIGGIEEDAVKVGIGTRQPAFHLEVIHDNVLPHVSGSDDAFSIRNGIFGNAWQIHTNGGDGWLSLYFNSSYRGGFSSSTGVYTEVSDKRLKDHIHSIPEGQLTQLQELRPVSYEMKDQAGSDRHYGLVAQEVLEVYPEIVHQMKTGEEEMLSLSYTELIPLLIKGMQEQQEIIDQLRDLFVKQTEENKSLQNQVDRFSSALEELRSEILHSREIHHQILKSSEANKIE